MFDLKENRVDHEPELVFLGFALSDCTVEIDSPLVKYVRAVHRTALELAIPNRFGLEIGGFWLTTEQIMQLRGLPKYYPANEACFVEKAIEEYLKAQLTS
jgi:hypothetical protein